MRIGWLVDPFNIVGGAELTQAEFRDTAPDDVEIVDCPPGHVDPDLDMYVIHNCLMYSLEDLRMIPPAKLAVKYWHDVGPHLPRDMRAWIDKNAVPVCCSPVQADHMGVKCATIPPPVPLDRFAAAAAKVNGDRDGAVSVAAWRNYDKAPYRVAEWAVENEVSIDFFGGGSVAPLGSQEVLYEDMPALLARYRTFVYLPTVIEPFGRLVVEAWAAGCEVVTNDLVGAKWWIENDPDALGTAADDFWKLVLA